jgi:hypothetical protein
VCIPDHADEARIVGVVDADDTQASIVVDHTSSGARAQFAVRGSHGDPFADAIDIIAPPALGRNPACLASCIVLG